MEPLSCEDLEIKVSSIPGSSSGVGDEYDTTENSVIEKISQNGQDISNKIASLRGKESGFVRYKGGSERIITEQFPIVIGQPFQSFEDSCRDPGCQEQSRSEWDNILYIEMKDGTQLACSTFNTSKCTGPTPTNATLIPGDDQGLSNNTTKSLVSTNTAAKCEYKCNDGYQLEGSSCKKIETDYRCEFKLLPSTMTGYAFTGGIHTFYVGPGTGKIVNMYAPRWNIIPEYFLGVHHDLGVITTPPEGSPRDVYDRFNTHIYPISTKNWLKASYGKTSYGLTPNAQHNRPFDYAFWHSTWELTANNGSAREITFPIYVAPLSDDFVPKVGCSAQVKVVQCGVRQQPSSTGCVDMLYGWRYKNTNQENWTPIKSSRGIDSYTCNSPSCLGYPEGFSTKTDSKDVALSKPLALENILKKLSCDERNLGSIQTFTLYHRTHIHTLSLRSEDRSKYNFDITPSYGIFYIWEKSDNVQFQCSRGGKVI